VLNEQRNSVKSIARKKKISFIDLIRPQEILPVDIRFEVYRWMAKTAQNYNKEKVVTKGNPCPSYGYEAIALMSRSSGHGHGSYPEGFRSDWENELKLRFQYVLLSKYPESEAVRWKEENGIGIDETRVLPIRHYVGALPDYHSPKGRLGLKGIFDFKGKRLKEQYNPFHPKANTILDISLGVYPDYNLCIHYGYEEELGHQCASRWTKDLPVVEGELFWDFVARNYLLLKDLVASGH
jgi:hypothetical protein